MEIVASKKTSSQNNTVPIVDILFKTLHYWPWLLLSLIITTGLGLLYAARTPYVYTEAATLLVKGEEKGKSTTGGYDQFGEFGLFSTNTNIQNEIMTIKSPDLMEDVVKRLNLDINYNLPGRFHKTVAYGTTLPYTVSLPDYPENSALEFKLEVNGSKVSIEDFKVPGSDDHPQSFSGSLGNPIATPAGPITILPNILDSEASGQTSRPQEAILYVSKIPLTAAVNSYEARLGVSQDANKGSVINLSFTDQNVQRADAVLNTVIEVYNEYWVADRNQVSVATSNFINERLAIIEQELGHVESDISAFKSANLIPDVGAAASAYFAETQSLSQSIMNLNNQIQMARYVRTFLQNESGSDKPLPASTGMDNLNIQTQISEYNATLLERNQLLNKSSDKNPLVQNLDKDLANMRVNLLSSIDNYLTNLQMQVKSLKGAQGAATSKLASSPSQEKYLLSVERQQKVKENLYLFLLQKREDNELSQAFSAYNTRVIKKPSASGLAPYPNKKMIVFSCALVGLLVPFVVIYASELLNTRVRGRKDVEHLSIPMLGEIPQHGKQAKLNKVYKRLYQPRRGKNAQTPRLVVKPGARDVINEAFRVLRTNVEFSRIHKEGCNVVAMTSFNPGSGKSFITMNLADAIAIKDKRVLVIDGDMRHGSASAYVGRPRQGLADYLAGNTSSLSSLIVPVEDTASSDKTTNLHILPVGSVPPNPTELLESPRFAELIETLKPDYDYILIDCPPIEVVADTQIIDKVADRTVFIVRVGLLERSMLSELENLSEAKKYNHMAFILNGTPNDQNTLGHKYKYGYGYGYGYGYNYANS